MSPSRLLWHPDDAPPRPAHVVAPSRPPASTRESFANASSGSAGDEPTSVTFLLLSGFQEGLPTPLAGSIRVRRSVVVVVVGRRFDAWTSRS